jgi:RNA polymerase sigma-70 factor (ECF subfamily)
MAARRSQEVEGPGARQSAQDATAWLGDHGDALYRYARARVGTRELAEDLVQDVFLAALQSRGRFEGRSTVRTWLLSILRHKIVDHYRGLEETLPPSVSHAMDRCDRIEEHYFSAQGLWKTRLASWKSPDKALEDREFWDVLDNCLSRLPRALASAFVLREFEGLEVTELRRTLAVSEGNLRVRLHRARLLLRECLERRWFAETPDRSRRST